MKELLDELIEFLENKIGRALSSTEEEIVRELVDEIENMD